jgi:nicotinamidase-related amidase
MEIGFLIVDMQKIFLQGKKEKLNIERACEHINDVADLLRSKNHCVIHIQDIEGEEDLNPELLDIISEIKREISLVIVAGFAAEHCVLFTYNGAKERGFKAVILQNGIISANSDVINNTYRDRNIISYPVIEFIVK